MTASENLGHTDRGGGETGRGMGNERMGALIAHVASAA